MDLRFELEKATAVKVAEHLASVGDPDAAAETWLAVSRGDPYDLTAREKWGDAYFERQQSGYPLGTAARSRFILNVMLWSYPTTKLRTAYFDNLAQLLRDKPKRRRAGGVVLGLGAGRCGSTTLAAAFAELPNACATHENPPLLFWEPLEDQLRFHIDRFRLLADYYAVVFDTAPPWINALDRFLTEFPEGKVIGLHRETNACVQSHMRIPGKGAGMTNHWVAPGSGFWHTTPTDPCYPSYPLPADFAADPQAAKAALIQRYVTEYNQAQCALAARWPGRLLLVATEAMNAAETATRLRDFLGLPLAMPDAKNVGSTSDSRRLKLDKRL